MTRLIKTIFILLNIVVGIAMTATAVISHLDATVHSRIVIAVMAFPVWVPLGIVLLITDFFLLRKWTVWVAFCFAVSLPLSLTVYPINIPAGNVPERFNATKWTLLSYNISQFTDITDEYPGGTNPGANYILDVDADVVVLPEGKGIDYVNNKVHISPELKDSLKERYPYFLIGTDISLMSKFPADSVVLKEFPDQTYEKSPTHSKVGCFIVNIHGKKTAIFGLHLKSLGLSQDDKDLYEDFTRGQGFTSRREMSDMKNDVISKITEANNERAVQTLALCRAINDIDYDNVIVCGDFNDTPGCFALNQLEKIGFREVYPLVGNGYMYTYNKDRLYFQIDHVLFKGSFFPWSMKRGNIKSSDHYPLIVTFI